MSTTTKNPAVRGQGDALECSIEVPKLSDGAEMWRIAKDSGALDLNSSYAYVLYARDFPRTCRIARVDGEVAGFILANVRPDHPEVLFVWQVAVDSKFRGMRLAARMLDDLVGGVVDSDEPVTTLETTITDDNIASQRLFEGFADRWSAPLAKKPLFEEHHFPDDHEAEPLYRIGPLRAPKNDN